MSVLLEQQDHLAQLGFFLCTCVAERHLESEVSQKCWWDMDSEPCAWWVSQEYWWDMNSEPWCHWDKQGQESLELWMDPMTDKVGNLFPCCQWTLSAVWDSSWLITAPGHRNIHVGKTSRTESNQTLPCHLLSRDETSSVHSIRVEKWGKLSHQRFWYNKCIHGNQNLLIAKQNCSCLHQRMVLIPSREGLVWKKKKKVWVIFFLLSC